MMMLMLAMMLIRHEEDDDDGSSFSNAAASTWSASEMLVSSSRAATCALMSASIVEGRRSVGSSVGWERKGRSIVGVVDVDGMLESVRWSASSSLSMTLRNHGTIVSDPRTLILHTCLTTHK